MARALPGRRRIGTAAAVAQAEQLQGVGDVTEPDRGSECVGPLFNGVGHDLERPTTGAAHQIVVMGITSGQPVASLAIIAMKGVQRTGLGQPPKLHVDGGDPHPQTLRSQVGAETTMEFLRAEKPVGTLENFKERPLARRVARPLRSPTVGVTALCE